jgi:hypothetical protein
MSGKKIFDEDPGGADGLRVVILSSVKKWLRVTVVRAWVNEHFARSFCLFHAGEKIDGGLHCSAVFGAGNHKDWTLKSLQPLCVDFVKAGPVNDHARSCCFRVVQICIERFLSAHAKSNGRDLPAWLF